MRRLGFLSFSGTLLGCFSILLLLVLPVSAQDCSAANPCPIGCCTKWGFCGLGPDYCGTDICVANCDRKSQCDPGGFGSDYAEKASCPLNVCCSKFGFCGMTDEFCDKKKVKQPSCSSDHNLPRVVGYYEGWSKDRPCNRFLPEQLPLGVYTHLNFAFASINPETFEIVPAGPRDPELYKRLTYLKKIDPDLRVFIAIGGWTFNDPGPTQTVFQRIAASQTNQRVFIKSLISFMATYGFDGVDLDWEYPEAPDRGGVGDDYVNFPRFIANLKAALRATGGRDVLSITLPASYWYLQHFDIIKLSRHVDFFNMMTYDFHGTWDKHNEWVGPYLNSHTNLTEIKTAMDLLWRNDINPSKVVLGTAFYGRSFSASSPNCLQPGCTYESGAPAHSCSNEVGVALNSEIDTIVETTGASPTLDEDAAVNILTYDKNKWVTFDDATTLAMKVNFARSQCMGGVMVWAVTHDTKEAKYSINLGKIVKRKNAALPVTPRVGVLNPKDDGLITATVQQAQCKWTNCGEGELCYAGDWHDSEKITNTEVACPPNWIRVLRKDPKARGGEFLVDETGCDGQGTHKFCCPPDTDAPKCGWYTHHNGKCDPTCPSGMTEVGSLKKHCSNGKYQAACCETTQKSMKLYSQCTWSNWPQCRLGFCPSDKSTVLTLAGTGSGAAECAWRDSDHVVLQQRRFCCNQKDESNRWEDCKEYNQYGDRPSGDQFFCRSGCPSDKVRISMNTWFKDNWCQRGGTAVCCTPNTGQLVKRESSQDAQLRDSLYSFIQDPVCDSDTTGMGLWSREVLVFQNATDAFEVAAGNARHGDHVALALKRGTSATVLHDVSFLIGALLTGTASINQVEIWDTVVPQKYPNLVWDKLYEYLQKTDELVTYGYFQLERLIACQLATYNAAVGGSSNHKCSVGSVTKRSLLSSPRLGTEDGILDLATRQAGPGQPRFYSSSFTTGQEITFSSASYTPSNLLPPDSPIRQRAYDYEDPYDCMSVDMGLLDLTGRATEGFHIEHELELNSMGRFFTQAEAGHSEQGGNWENGRIPASFFTDTLFTRYPANVQLLPMRGGGQSDMPITRIMNALGSVSNTDPFVLLRGIVNTLKTAFWQRYSYDHIDNMVDLREDIQMLDVYERTLNQMRGAISVYEYMLASGVWFRFQDTVREVRSELLSVAWLHEQRTGVRVPIDMIWQEFIEDQLNQFVSHGRGYVEHIDDMVTRLYGDDDSADAIALREGSAVLRQRAQRIRLPDPW